MRRVLPAVIVVVGTLAGSVAAVVASRPTPQRVNELVAIRTLAPRGTQVVFRNYISLPWTFDRFRERFGDDVQIVVRPSIVQRDGSAVRSSGVCDRRPRDSGILEEQEARP